MADSIDSHEKISIIIPVYNSVKTLERCLKSCLEQTYENTEIVVVDDGSTDDSVSVYNKYKKDKRMHLIRQKNNGPASARNNGLIHCSGSWCVFVDADDYLDENAIEVLSKSTVGGATGSWFTYIYKRIKEGSQRNI